MTNIVSLIRDAVGVNAWGSMLRIIVKEMDGGDVDAMFTQIHRKWWDDHRKKSNSQRRRRRTTGYIWRTSHDSNVRAEHRLLDGKFFLWKSPPVADRYGARYHPGGRFGCRCFAEPVSKGRGGDEGDARAFINGARMELGLPASSGQGQKVLASQNREDPFEDLSGSAKSVRKPSAKNASRPVRRQKRIVWGGN